MEAEKAYQKMTESLLLFLVSGLFLGLSTYIGLTLLESLSPIETYFDQISVATTLLISSSAGFAPLIAGIAGVYLGYELEGGLTNMTLASFTSIFGYFLLNILALALALQSFSGDIYLAEFGNPLLIFYSTLALENSIVYFAIPTMIAGIIGSYFGSMLDSD